MELASELELELELATDLNHRDQQTPAGTIHCSTDTMRSLCRAHKRYGCSKESENLRRLCLDHSAGSLRWTVSKQQDCYRRSVFPVERVCYSETLTAVLGSACFLRRKDPHTLPVTIHYSNATMRSLCRAHKQCGCSKEFENLRRLSLDHCAGSLRWKESIQQERYRRSE